MDASWYNRPTLRGNDMEKIGKWAFRAYMVYSICADMALLAGIIWLILK